MEPTDIDDLIAEDQKKENNYLVALQKIFKSEEGKLVMQMWKDIYLYPDSTNEYPHIMQYLMGQKDFLIAIEHDLNKPINTYHNGDHIDE